MYKRILLTGASGFVGPYVERQFPVSPFNDQNGPIDLRDQERVLQGVQSISPDAVIHLAAQSFIPDSFSDPKETFSVNFIGTYHLLEALSRTGFKGRMLYVSSGDVYGRVPIERLPVNESFLTLPRNPYAVSKVAAEALCYQWSQTSSFDVIIARPFNHIGKGQSRRFALADFAWQLVEISRGRLPPVIKVGDIDVTRDFTDVHDIVRAYESLMLSGENGNIYNVCSGKEYSIRSLIEVMKRLIGIDPDIVQDKDRLRPAEQRRMRGDYTKIQEKTGWNPQIPIEESLRNLLKGWQETDE